MVLFLIDSVWVARHCRSWLGFTTRLEPISSPKSDYKEGYGEDIRPIPLNPLLVERLVESVFN